MSRVAAAGATSRPSSATTSPPGVRMSIKHPPPMPLLCPSTTPSVSAAATAASTAVPPSASARAPAAVAIGWTVATMPAGSTATDSRSAAASAAGVGGRGAGAVERQPATSAIAARNGARTSGRGEIMRPTINQDRPACHASLANCPCHRQALGSCGPTGRSRLTCVFRTRPASARRREARPARHGSPTAARWSAATRFLPTGSPMTVGRTGVPDLVAFTAGRRLHPHFRTSHSRTSPNARQGPQLHPRRHRRPSRATSRWTRTPSRPPRASRG